MNELCESELCGTADLLWIYSDHNYLCARNAITSRRTNEQVILDILFEWIGVTECIGIQ